MIDAASSQSCDTILQDIIYQSCKIWKSILQAELGVTRYLCSALRNNITFCSKK